MSQIFPKREAGLGLPVRRNTAAMIEKSVSNFQAAYQSQVMGLRARSLDRRDVELVFASGRRKVVDFVRCSYLGLDNHPDLINGAIEAIRDYGSLHWSCARTRLSFELLGELEEDLSALFRANVITYSTVLAANMSALPLIGAGALTNGQKPVMVFDRYAHATLAAHKASLAADTSVLTVDHNDIATLETICRRNPVVAYVCDGLYSMGGAAPMQDLLELQSKYGLFLYVDDAHGISLFGRNGEGYARSQIPGELGERTIIAASMGKGFGASGGLLMLGSQHQDDMLRRFGLAHAFSVPVNLAGVGAAKASAALHRGPQLQALQLALRERVRQFDSLIDSGQSGSAFPIRTITLGNEAKAIEAARILLESGFYTSAIFFPTVAQGHAGLRICPTATHSATNLSDLAQAVTETIAQLSTSSTPAKAW